MRQKHLGITVNRPELVCHKQILPATTPEIRKTRIGNSPLKRLRLGPPSLVVLAAQG
jgi:hypothetical protein